MFYPSHGGGTRLSLIIIIRVDLVVDMVMQPT